MSNFRNIHHGGGNGSDGPPQSDNPILTAYENYCRETPIVTQTILTLQTIAFIMSIFVNLELALANVPFFTVFKFEIYRIFTSFLVSTGGFITLFFAYFSFVPIGRRLEHSMGSAEFIFLFLTIGVMTNIGYIVIAFLLDALQGGWLIRPTSGLWNVLFGVISLECTKAPQGSLRKIFLFTVPVLRYPLVLFGLFSFMNASFSLAHLISIGLGYGFGYGYLDAFRISSSRCNAWEEQYLQNFISQDRSWIVSSFATGSGAWSDEMATTNDPNNGGGLDGFFSRWTSQGQQQQQQQQQQPFGRSSVAMGSDGVSEPRAPRPGRVIKPSAKNHNTSNSTSGLPTSGGQKLGGGSRVQHTDPRQARLQALERRKAAV